MKKEILAISISHLLLFISISGCMDETSTVEDSDIAEGPKMVEISNKVYLYDNGDVVNFTKIQDAIDHVDEGGTIFVKNGTYYEMLIINKSINLIGESKDNTIIEYKIGSKISSDNIIFIDADNCTIKGFNITCVKTLSKSIIGITIGSSNNTIVNNIIMYANQGVNLKSGSINNTISWNDISYVGKGIAITNSDNNNISKNNISSCKSYGIYLTDSDNNIISSNIISDNDNGIRITGSKSKNNTLLKNTIVNSKQGLLCCCGAKNNVIYYNNFQQNNVYNARDDVTNQWDHGNVGNYWDDYREKYPDAIQIDGIWDTPYNITTRDNIDRFPLVNPIDI